MATLQGRAIKDTYKDLLQVSNSNNGVDGTLRTIEDGEGTSSALQVSSGAVKINGTLDVTGSVTGVPHVDYQGNYSASTSYVKDDVVVYNGSSYINTNPSTGVAPTNTNNWGILASKGTDGTDGTNGTTGPQGPQGPQGPAGADGATGADGADGADGSAANFANYSLNGHKQAYPDSNGNIFVTGRGAALQVVMNATNGTTDHTTLRNYNFSDESSVQIGGRFANVDTAIRYLKKYHNNAMGMYDFRFETDITDADININILDTRHAGIQYIGDDPENPRKWTIGNLIAPLSATRSNNLIKDIHIEVQAAQSSAPFLFGAFEGGYIETRDKIAIDLGPNVYFPVGVFWNVSSHWYGQQTRLELRNNLSSINLCQPIWGSRGGSGYSSNVNVYAGQFHQCRMLGNAQWIQHPHTMGYADVNGDQWDGLSSATSGNWFKETNYSFATGYIEALYPAFRFEGIGNSVDWEGIDAVSTDVMRLSQIVGQTERYDVPIVGVGMPNPMYSQTSGGTNTGLQFDWSDPATLAASNTTNAQPTSFAFGSSPYFMNKIWYPWGNGGTDFTHTSYRGWAFAGITANLATKTFSILS